MVVDFNFRFSHRVDARVAASSASHAVLDRHGAATTTLAWTLGGEPFLTTPGDAERRAAPPRSAPRPASTTELSTTGGTRDGRFIAKICPQVVEFGPVNASIHKIDEHVDVADIEPLKNIYRRTLEAAARR